MKTKVLISSAVTAKLICVFVLAFAKIQFSHVKLSGTVMVISDFVTAYTKSRFSYDMVHIQVY